ncbi:MAG TPA: HAD family phosphatase [Bacteroidales bacterium]|jgi:putative hydrolase of the HAD superfamily|nr:HAD family phosphatase [Bacteroidales bacterium]HRS18440.1 HAD family phosphatase [Bacteroidales bacterium]
MNQSLKHIEAIIFDFGGVVLNLDEQQTYTQMSNLLGISLEDLQNQVLRSKEFFNLECGTITPNKFIEFIHSKSKNNITDSQIIKAWNAMLLDLPQQHVTLLLELKKHFRTFLLSNTNAIHEDCFVTNIKNQGYTITLQDMFETVWYSHVLGLRKPNKDIFIEVAKRADLNPTNTLFIDDRIDNIQTAQELGFKTHHITPQHGIIDYFAGYL